MPQKSDARFLNAAVEIGEYLVGSATVLNNQLSWNVFDKRTQTSSDEQTSLYSGSSGIGLFFLELYKHTQDKSYLQVARRAILTAAAREKTKPANPSFVCGRLGVAYALAKLHEVTGAATHRQQALALARSCSGVDTPRYDYLGGSAGALLALLHIHAVCKEPWLLQMADGYVNHFLEGLQHGAKGAYWDRGPFEIRPLCGFSHGTAGIGFVFLELGHYLKNTAFFSLAEQAFAYENTYFDEEHNNWPDFRLKMWEPQDIANMEAAYKKGDTSPFYRAKYMTAWCHGAPGIGLARLLAYQLTGNQLYKRDADRAIRATRSANLADISLCHGLAGNMEIFIESYLAFGRPHDLASARALGGQLVGRWKEIQANAAHGNAEIRLDPSLFSGIAGAGYNLLRLHDARLTPSILAPRLPGTYKKAARTELPALGVSHPDIQNIIKEDTTASNRIKSLKRQMVLRYPSSGFLYIRQRVAQKSLPGLQQLGDAQLLERTLQLDPLCVLDLPSENKGLLLRYTPHAIEQKPISPFCYIVLMGFAKPQNAREVAKAINEKYSITQPEEYLQARVLEQVRQALNALILFYEQPTPG